MGAGKTAAGTNLLAAPGGHAAKMVLTRHGSTPELLLLLFLVPLSGSAQAGTYLSEGDASSFFFPRQYQGLHCLFLSCLPRALGWAGCSQ